MDWQVIILTLGASLITGIVTIVGNIIVSHYSLKKTLLENQYLNRKEFLDKRIKAYDDLLKCITEQSKTKMIKDDNFQDQKEKISEIWKENYHYCSKQVNRMMSNLIKYFDFSNTSKIRIQRVSDEMKKDIDKFYGIKDKEKRNSRW